MSKAIDFLKEHESQRASHWRDDAQWRRDNAGWLKYSRLITWQVLNAMEEQHVTQVELARRIGCTQQYVSNLLKGSTNMTLETIEKLEKALSMDILQSFLSRRLVYSSISTPAPHYLNDSDDKE